MGVHIDTIRASQKPAATQIQVPVPKPVAEHGAKVWNLPWVSLAGLWRKLLIWNRRWQQRQRLAQMEDRLLKDIGMTRYQAEQEAAKPFWRP